MRNSLEQFKLETAAELGLLDYDQIDKGLLPSRVNGMVGGMMVRKMIRLAESVLAAQDQLGEGSVENLVISSGVTDNDRKRVQETLVAMQMLQNPLPEVYQVDRTPYEQHQLH